MRNDKFWVWLVLAWAWGLGVGGCALLAKHETSGVAPLLTSIVVLVATGFWCLLTKGNE